MQEPGVRLSRALALPLALISMLAAPALASADISIDSPEDGAVYPVAPQFNGHRSLDPALASTVNLHLSGPASYDDSAQRIYSDPELVAMFDEWEFLPAPMPDGHYSFEASQEGDPGPDGAVASVEFDLDSIAPQTSFTATPDQFSQDTSPAFEFAAGDPDPSTGIDGFECSLDGVPFSPCESGDEFTTPEGAHELYVRAIDKAGNPDPTPAGYTWMVDTTTPEITIKVPATKQRFLLHQGNPNYNCSDPLAAGPPPVASGIAQCAALAFDNENLGPHEFRVRAVDRAGNETTKRRAYVIDPPNYGAFVGADNPLAYYRMDEAIGSSDIKDRSGNGHDGTYQNGIALGRDGATACERRPHPPRACELAHPARNNAAFFPSRDGHGYVNGIAAPTNAYTMEAWIKPRDGGDMMIVSHGGGGQLFISGGHLAFRQTQDTIHGGGPALQPGKWWHVAATWTGTNTRLYVNGDQIGASSSANKPPSGISTFFVGYGEMAPWFHGDLDEVAYYGRALNRHAFQDRYKIGVATDHASVEPGASVLNTEGPNTDPVAPKNDGLYAPTKTPDAEFECTDPDGAADVATCTATVDGAPIVGGDPLPDSIGTHQFVVSATDLSGNSYEHTHTYRVRDFSSIYGYDSPIAYYRLGDGAGVTMVDASPNHRSGIYKNKQESGPVGIAGDGDTARRFWGDGGYGYVNDIAAPRFGATLVAWVNADDDRDQAIAGHGDAGELFVRGGTFRFRHMDVTVDSGVTADPGHWQQVVGVWDGVELKIYIDGERAASVEATRRPSSISTFYVGFGELGPWFKGVIDEVAYYETALDADRVYQLWLADPPPANSDLEPPPTDDPPDDPGPEPAGPGADPIKAQSSSARLERGKLWISISCLGRTDCRGTADVSADLGRRKAAVGSKKFGLPAGQTRHLTIKPKKKVRKKLKRSTGFVVRLSDSSGKLLNQKRYRLR